MKKITLIILATLLFSCTGEPINTVQSGDFTIELLFEKNGCKMYRFKDNGRYVYWSDCSGRTEQSITRNNGKTSTTTRTTVLTDR
jgi:hypothetical protein